MPLRDAAWHDRMYNNRALVPDHGEHFARWACDSRQVRESVPCTLDVPYGDGPNETLDIFAGPEANAPVVVFIHGGYWRSLDKSDHSFVVPALRAQGACVVVVNYALCPGSADRPITIADIALQMAKALAWIWHQIGQYGGAASRISLIGHSAGGHLAAMLLACDWKKIGKDLPRDLVQRGLSISGLYELEPMRRTSFLQADLRLTPAQVRALSPARWSAPQRRVLHAVVGAEESPEFLRHNRLIQKAWGKRTVSVCEDLPGLNHFSVLGDLVRPGTRLHALAAEQIVAS